MVQTPLRVWGEKDSWSPMLTPRLGASRANVFAPRIGANRPLMNAKGLKQLVMAVSHSRVRRIVRMQRVAASFRQSDLQIFRLEIRLTSKNRE